jgi:hypothetical protein
MTVTNRPADIDNSVTLDKDRYLAIVDESRKNTKSAQRHNANIHRLRYQIWERSKTLKAFAHDASISANRARELDKMFAAIAGVKPKSRSVPKETVEEFIKRVCELEAR